MINKTPSWLRFKLVWLGLGIFALLLRLAPAQFIESFYSRGLFLGVRWFIDNLLAWIPIPLIYLFFLALTIGLVAKLRSFFLWKTTVINKVLAFSMSLLSFLGGGLFFFLFLWGFNYGRLPIEKQLALELNPLNGPQLWEELQLETEKLIELRQEIRGANNQALAKELFPKNLEQKLRGSVEKWLKEHGFPTTGKVRGRFMYPKGIFLHFSSSGLYFPFTGEGHIDAGLHPLQWPYVMSHELGHGYGFGDEGTCNFLAYVSCANASDPLIAYCGRLIYWRTLAVNFQRHDRDKYWAFRGELPAGIQEDLDAINENLSEYKDVMPKMRYAAYNTYLKAQGIKEGMKKL